MSQSVATKSGEVLCAAQYIVEGQVSMVRGKEQERPTVTICPL
jgi:hypothetical protein